MDLSTLDMTTFANQGAVMEVTHPVTLEPMQHDGSPVTITVLGQDSDHFRKEIQRRAKNQLMKRQKITDTQLVDDAIDTLASITVGWQGICENGTLLEFNTENVRYVYHKYTWLRQQVDEFSSDRANFFKA